jgi:hypothetical protein
MADPQHRPVDVLPDAVKVVSSPTTSPQSELIRSYIAVAHETANIEALETFIQSKIQPGHKGATNPLTRKGKTFGWAGLVLDDAGKEEIAGHEGVLGVRESPEVHNN